MTPDQQRLVDDNHNLIYFVLRKHGWEIDEFCGIAAIALCKAAINFDSSRGIEFSTYACSAIRWEILKTFRDGKMQKRTADVVSLNDPAGPSGGLTLGDFIRTIETPETEVFKSDLIRQINMLPERERIAVRLHIAGYRQREISAAMHFSQAEVSRALIRGKKKLQLAV